MKRTGLFLAGILALSACGGSGDNPLTGGSNDEDAPDGSGGLEGTSLLRDEVAGVSYNEDTDEVTIVDLPFDGPAGVYENTGITTLGSFGVYDSIQTTETGRRQYYAVFARSDSGALSGTAVGTGDYQDFGFGGAAIARSTTSVDIPTSGEAVYTGEYGGVRILNDGGGVNDVHLVSGNAIIDLDFADFEDTGAVEGNIVNRTVYDVNGNRLGTLPTITLATGAIDPDGTITGGGAGTVDSAGDQLQGGTWEALLGGADSTEIAGIIVIEGPDEEGSEIDSRETGVFIAVD